MNTPRQQKKLSHRQRNPVVGTHLHFEETTILLMDKSDFLSKTENKENSEYLFGCHVLVQDNGNDAENVEYAINKFAFSYVLVTVYDTSI